MTLTGAIDYWCNAFTPDRQEIWERMIGDQGIPLKVIRDGDGFCNADEMVARLDASGFATVVAVAADLQDGSTLDGFEHVALRPAEIAALTQSYPGRFVATWSIDPTSGMAGVQRAAEMLDADWCVGLHSHTHSWDRTFDHADYYPYYALCADNDVPFVMQAGTSGGRFPSECGRPIGIDRPAIYFPSVRFVLSHLGWPWLPEAIAMSLKFANVYIGTATYPARRWPDELLDFLTGVGRTKVLYGSGFPTTGHAQAASQIPELGLDPHICARLTHETAQSVFTRIQTIDRSGA
jgi:predicted TIM-barrel fold metal-dependent hydrolase